MGWIQDFTLNKHWGQVSFGLHRITGVLLAIYLIPHILLNSSALVFGPKAYTEITGSVQGPAFHFLELAIILGVAFHLFNGVRLILVDFFRMTRSQKKLFNWVMALTAAAMIYSLWVYLPKMLHHGA
jgi:succinate dehydrogenase / fumarate reductase cytochrome b subunit